jgi:hypothetical protein
MVAAASEQARVKLERENAELRRANEILRKASAFFARAEFDRSSPRCPFCSGRIANPQASVAHSESIPEEGTKAGWGGPRAARSRHVTDGSSSPYESRGRHQASDAAAISSGAGPAQVSTAVLG